MKTTITLLLFLFTGMNSFAQQFIDIVNAPLNPIGYIENRNQLNLKGDIALYYAEDDGSLYFDKNGNRLFNIVHTYTDKEEARNNNGVYLELDNQKRVVYKENFFFRDKTFYTYNPNGTIAKIEVQSQYPSVRTFEYDNKKRKVKEIYKRDAGTTVQTYTYQTIGNSLVITVSVSETFTENNQSTSRTYQYTYENGLMMKYISDDGSTNNYKYTFDDKGNQLTWSHRFGTINREFYYHSELGQWDNWRWIYKKTNTTYSPYLMIGDRQIRNLTFEFNDLDNFIDILIYEPITSTTLVAENAVTTTGLSQGTGGGKISTLKAKNFMYTSVKGNIKFFVEGNNQSGNIKQVFVGKTYAIYDASSLQTYWCRDFDKGKKFNVFEDLGKDALLWYKNEKNDVYLWQKGDYVSASGYTQGETLNDGSKLLYKNQKPALVLENFTTSAQRTFYKAVPYSGQAIPKNTTSNTSQTTTTTGSNTSEQTTETRYYNGRYDSTNGLSSKEVVLHKINSYINIKNKAGATFLKLEEKSDFLSGTWTIKSPQGDIFIALDYLIGDKSLTVKLKYLMVGSQVISKNHPKEEIRNLHNVAIEYFILDLFKYLEIKNNTTSKQTTPATGSNSNSQYVADANSFSEAFKKGKSEGQQQLYSLMKAQRNLNKNDAQIATYFYQLYHYLYPKDVKMSFELVYLLPLTELTAAAPITKIVKSLMTKEEYQTFANQAYDRLYNDK